jgi:pimeloyl-ACP methyl ester carboxylesterase
VIFVHGFFGSGAQFESQKMRLTSNGYPERYIRDLEYDSTFGTESRQMVFTRLDALVAELKQQTGKAKVDILGHSLGTSVMQEYLNSSPARASNVAHYVNIDGQQAASPPGGVPTLAIWAGRGAPGRSLKGAKNVTIPNQTHVESATSAEAFVEFFKFFTGEPPATSTIVPEAGRITIAGRAVLFPQNRGVSATGLEVWRIDHATGHRIGSEPVARTVVGANGGWGPVPIQAGRYYEFALVRPGVATLHYYYEPFLRSDHLIRLFYNDAIEALVERGERHTGALVIRYKELWGDQGRQNDVLRFNGVNACTAAICPIDKRVNALFAFDRLSDGRTDLSAPHPVFSSLAFITAADIFLPAARPATGTTTVSLRSRGEGPVRTLTLPNFASTTESASLYFNDFEEPVASPATVDCIDARGRARGRRLGPVRLGTARSHQRRALQGKRRRSRRGRDRYCVVGGGGLRIGYPTARLSRHQRSVARRRSILILTSSPRFTVRGIRPGAPAATMRRRLRGERRVTLGRNRWFVARGRAATLVYKIRGRRVHEVGIADRRLTRGVSATRRFLWSWGPPRRR